MRRADDGISYRQWEVLQAVADGRTINQTAEYLGITPSTVRSHLHIVYRRLRAQNAAQAVSIVLNADPDTRHNRGVRRLRDAVLVLGDACEAVAACPEGTVSVIAIEKVEEALLLVAPLLREMREGSPPAS